MSFVIIKMLYLFAGEDELAKQEKINSLKSELLKKGFEDFNFEFFYAKELTLPLFKESLSRLPLESPQRIIVIKDVFKLKDELKDYFAAQIEKLPADLILILESAVIPKEESGFFNKISRRGKVILFKAKEKIDAFGLARAIERKDADSALNMLVDLFRNGEKPERILGALRYRFVKSDNFSSAADSLRLKEKKEKVGLLMEADLNLKTGKVKPEFALEALVVKLCGLA
ncbi:MAG: hypothetical protein AABZ27_02945 [Candidatus Omnitrophota bacterium]